MNVKYIIWLAIGVVLTVLFFIFRVPIHELFYYSTGFSNAAYNFSIYNYVSILVIAVPWIMALIYYYVINSVHFDRAIHWVAMWLLTIVLTPTLCVLWGNFTLNEVGKSYLPDMMQLGLVDMLLAAVMFVIASFSIKWWSSNCRHTPFL